MLAFQKRSSAVLLGLVLGGCPLGFGDSNGGDEPVIVDMQPRAATHSGLVSIQDISIANLSQAGHGLTVQAFFTPQRAPDFIEAIPGTPFGCQASAYNLDDAAAPPQQDHGQLEIEGLNGGAIQCQFSAARGYICPTASGSGRVQISAGRYMLDGLTLTAADVGRYLQLLGASKADNNGAFAIIGVDADGGVALANPRSVAEELDGQYTVLAGAGPTPNDLYEPFIADTRVRVRLSPNEEAAFDAFDVQIEPGSELTLDTESAQQIVAVEPKAEALELGCDGPGGTCGSAAASVIRITTTDADTTGLPPTIMPPALHWAVEVQCAFPDAKRVRVPSAAMALLHKAHERSPITRIRTAFMRDGFAQAGTQAPKPANSTIIVAGHGILGFSNPGRP